MRKGFTLIEIAIVLVIIGLLVGGILLGRDLIRASELRAVMTNVNQYSSALNLFESKMSALPGDMRNAASYWSTTTNGNGNNKIDYNGGAAGEEYYVWQQLALAGMIPGSYTGATTSLPGAPVKQGYYRLSYQTDIYTTSGHLVSLNAMNTAMSAANLAILSPKEVYSLDLKSDDGLADSGSIMGFNEEAVPGCVTNDYTVGDGDYLSTSTDIKCKIFFTTGR